MATKLIKEFVVPRGRVPTEVSRALQDIQVSLQNLEQAVLAMPDVAALKLVVEALEQSVIRQQEQNALTPDAVQALIEAYGEPFTSALKKKLERRDNEDENGQQKYWTWEDDN